MFPDNPSILSELCSTLSRLAVRNEFCQEVVDLGGLSVLVALLTDCSDHQVGVHNVSGCEAPCLSFPSLFSAAVFSLLCPGFLWLPQ